MRLSSDTVRTLAARQGDAITTAQLAELGADRSWVARQVTSGRWQRLHRGVLVTYSGPPTWLSRAWAALLYAGSGAALSHESAAFRHGFAPTPRLVTVSVPVERRVTPSRGLQLYRRSAPIRASGRLRTVWPADTVVDLVAGARSVDDAVGWVCAASRAGTNRLELADAIARRGAFRNVGLLRDLMAEVSAGIESPLEHRYHHDVERRHGLPRARLQVREVVAGLWIRADVVYEGYGVRVELDGNLGHPGGRTDADTWRDNAVLLAVHELTLRYRWRHVRVTPCATAGQVAAALTARGWRGSVRRCGPLCTAVGG